ncbi:efflux RND transporter periplasmic adaptor subunit [Cohnella hongkongensis]|uniref:Efflux RND transporter periplasmic adaptor subunit n=1 Tax=Cohnella hongkongensis TaxID=178337 RepID=A0ABV9FGK7_9BACL
MLYMKWPTDSSSYDRRKRPAVRPLTAAMLAMTLLLAVTGCSLLPSEEEPERLPEIRTPKISQKPEYEVKRGTLETKVGAAGKLMSEKEENLFFTEDNRRIVDVRVKAGDEVKKGQVLAELDTGDTESQLMRKEIELEKAELDLKQAMREDSDEDGVALRKRQLDYELLKKELDELRRRLEGSQLVAPYSGTIVSFTAKKGDLARAYEKIGQIADMSALVVAVKFGSSDLAHVAPGMEAIVGINTAGEHRGTVRRLPVGSGDAGGDSLDAYALIDLPKLPDGVGHGTPLNASVVVEKREGTLYIPAAALRKQNSRHYVIVSHPDGSKGEADVEIGIQTATEVEIIKGLEEGQKVVGK